MPYELHLRGRLSIEEVMKSYKGVKEGREDVEGYLNSYFRPDEDAEFSAFDATIDDRAIPGVHSAEHVPSMLKEAFLDERAALSLGLQKWIPTAGITELRYNTAALAPNSSSDSSRLTRMRRLFALSLNRGETILAVDAQIARCLVEQMNLQLATHNATPEVPTLPANWAMLLRRIYKGVGFNLIPGSKHLLDQMLKLKRKPHYSPLLEVPAKYRRAYRLMTDIDRVTLQKMIGEEKELLPGSVRVKQTYWPKADNVSSWTVDPRIFLDANLLEDIGIHNPDPNRFIVLLEAKLEDQSDKFLYNPDTLPNYLKTGNFGKEREVLSVGPVQVSRLTFFYPGKDGDKVPHAQGLEELRKNRSKDR